MKLTKQRLKEIIREEAEAERSRDPDRLHGVKPAPVKRTWREKDIGADLGLGGATISPVHVRGAQLRRRANRAAGYSSSGHRTQAGQERLETPGTKPADQPLLDIGADPDKIAALRQAEIDARLGAKVGPDAPEGKTVWVLPADDETDEPFVSEFPIGGGHEISASEVDYIKEPPINQTIADAIEAAIEKKKQSGRVVQAGIGSGEEPEQQQESLELNEEITRWHKLAGLRG